MLFYLFNLLCVEGFCVHSVPHMKLRGQALEQTLSFRHVNSGGQFSSSVLTDVFTHLAILQITWN